MLRTESREDQIKNQSPWERLTECLERNTAASVPDYFQSVVRRYPDRCAITEGNHSLSYAELNQAANRIARAIDKQRGHVSEPIGLLFGPDIGAIAALLGISKAGKFYVPLDPSFPMERNRTMLDDAQSELIVTNRQNFQSAVELVGRATRVVNVDEIDDDLCCDDINFSSSLDDVFAVVYTSGSTGRPRGVMMTHRNRLHDTMLHASMAEINIDDRLSLLQSPGAVAAEIQLFRSLLTGASLFLFDVRLEGIHRLVGWLDDRGISVFHTPPAVFRQLSELIPEQGRLRSLRLIQLSGAPILQCDFDAYKTRYSAKVRFAFHMGSTEAGAISSTVVDQNFIFPEGGAPVGYPYPSKKVVILDGKRRQSKTGEIGEIAVKSRYLAQGYWLKPELTAGKFLPNPDGGDEKLYLTGDLGRLLPDGFLMHHGRKDFMVKIHGNRVELGEIEKVLLGHPHVIDAVVRTWGQELGEINLAAYVVPGPRSSLTVRTLRELLRTRLPGFMIPSYFVLMDSFPLVNGKVDRQALPKPDGRRPELDTPLVLPVRAIEKRLVQVWEDVLAVHPIGIHDDFFDLGGHSLAASQVVSRVIGEFQLEISLRSLFEAPTVAAMASVVAAHEEKTMAKHDLSDTVAALEALTEEDAKQLIEALKNESRN